MTGTACGSASTFHSRHQRAQRETTCEPLLLKSVKILNVFCRFIVQMVSVSLLPPLPLSSEVGLLSLFIKYLRVFLRDQFCVSSRSSVTVILPLSMCFFFMSQLRGIKLVMY